MPYYRLVSFSHPTEIKFKVKEVNPYTWKVEDVPRGCGFEYLVRYREGELTCSCHSSHSCSSTNNWCAHKLFVLVSTFIPEDMVTVLLLLSPVLARYLEPITRRHFILDRIMYKSVSKLINVLTGIEDILK